MFYSDSRYYLVSRELLLLCWFYRDEHWGDGGEIMASISFTAIVEQPDYLSAFIKQEVIDVYGAEAYLARASVSLLRLHTDKHTSLHSFLSNQRNVITRAEFNEYFHKSGYVRSLCTALRRKLCRHHPDPDISKDYAVWAFVVAQSGMEILTCVPISNFALALPYFD